MNDGTGWSWEDMIAEFRRLGGSADNLRPGTGPFGRGLFAIDPARPVRLHVPPALLVPTDLLVARDDRLTIRPDAPVDPALRAFVERYEANFSFGAGAAADCRAMLAARAGLPAAIRAHIDAILPPDPDRFAPPDDARVLRHFVATRAATPKGGSYLMPVAELINHGIERAPFDMRDGVRIEGRFENEILVRYGMGDAWEMFLVHDAAIAQPVAFSMRFGCRTAQGRQIRVLRDFETARRLGDLPAPTVENQGDALVLSHLMIGSRQAPAMPRTICARVLGEAGIGGSDTLFDLVAHANRGWYYRLLTLLDEAEAAGTAATAATGTMRRAIMLQLEALSFAIGHLPEGR